MCQTKSSLFWLVCLLFSCSSFSYRRRKRKRWKTSFHLTQIILLGPKQNLSEQLVRKGQGRPAVQSCSYCCKCKRQYQQQYTTSWGYSPCCQWTELPISCLPRETKSSAASLGRVIRIKVQGNIVMSVGKRDRLTSPWSKKRTVP